MASKTGLALEKGLGVILCCGETLEVSYLLPKSALKEGEANTFAMKQRDANQTVSVVTGQLQAVANTVRDWSKVVIAYEPIW